MITKQEIIDFSREFSLSPNTVEKDYVLGWLLAGIANNLQLTERWIFKGGTCLKKCYFETYRFSEDLDYTLLDSKHLDEDFLVGNFKEISNWIYDTVGIEIPTETIHFEIYKNSAGKTSIYGKVGYIGPLQRRQDPVRIKLDLTADEILALTPVKLKVHHPYSDKPPMDIYANCYSFAEIFAEKIRALAERARPRDLYDVIHLYRHAHEIEKPTIILQTLKKKCDYKNIIIPVFKHIAEHSKYHELETTWKDMLAHQLPMLPPWQQFWDDLPELFKWLHGESKKVIQKSIPSSTTEKYNDSWRPPSMIRAWNAQIPLELIRYAAANHLCIELTYQNNKRLIEPYNLKKTQDGNLILLAIKHTTGEDRSYRVDKIQAVEISSVSFIPKYIISLTPLIIQQRLPKRRLLNTHKYIIQCNHCGKKFKRTTPNTRLRQHKNTHGYQCSERLGHSLN